MVSDQRSILVTRREQAFPILTPQEIDRLRHFGETRRYKPGEYLARAGERAPGMLVVQSGEVDASQHDALGHDEHIITHPRGSFSAELSSLSGAPALVNAVAKTEVEALVIPPERLRALMVEEAELGERIMRALILRRMGLLETGHSGPVILGNPEHADVLRLGSFLDRYGHPHQIRNPASDDDAKALVQQLNIAETELPVVVCPTGQRLHNPSEERLAKCLGLVQPIDPAKLYDVAIVGAGPAGLAAAVYAASEGL